MFAFNCFSFSLGLYNYLFTLFEQVLAPLLHLGEKKKRGNRWKRCLLPTSHHLQL